MTGMKFGKVQLKIMNVLWQKKRSTAVEITTEINKTGYYIAHSTVQTHMRALEKKGAVGHDMDDRTFIFYPLVDTDNVARHAVSDMVDTIFRDRRRLWSLILSGTGICHPTNGKRFRFCWKNRFVTVPGTLQP